jgi:hypothetical protein
LLGRGIELAEAETLIRHFGLSQIQFDYIQKSIRKQKRRRRLRDYVRSAVTAGLAILATLWVVDWSKTEILRKKGAQDGTRAPQSTKLATNQHSLPEAQPQDAQRAAQQNPELATTQRNTPEARLKQTQEQKPQEDIPQRAQPNADLAASHNSAADTQSQKEQKHFQAAQEDARLAADKPQIEPLNPSTNEMPSAAPQPLDPSIQSAHP